jgi:putative transposase
LDLHCKSSERRVIKEVSKACQISMIAYSLLPNHYHWLARQDGQTPMRLLPQRVFGSYTLTFNHRYGRSGTLFGDRFRAKLVDSDEYLRHLCLYIHANPVRHGIAAAPELWPYSNYLEWIGARDGTLVDRDVIQNFFGDSERYRQCLVDYLAGAITLPTALSKDLDELERD